MKQFETRGLEFHSSRMWQWAAIERALDFMTLTGLNALIFHQNDLIDQLVFPEDYFSVELMWKRWPVRMHTIQNNRQYIGKVVREAKERGIAFYPQVKEIWYPEGLLEFFPALRKADGTLCPSDPFWWEFMEKKTRELLTVMPDIAGVIVSPGTRESKISISTNKCDCERCKSMDAKTWYNKLLDAMYRPLAEKGKRLVVRDFAYTAHQQNMMIDAATQCSDKIVVALKNTPHDFYPTFPTNPRIGHSGAHPQWVEFDTWGQFFGIGFFPVSVIEDMQGRMRQCAERGVTGIWLRTDWEVMTEASSFNSLNTLNMFGGALIAKNVDVDLNTVYKSWFNYGLCSAHRSGTHLQAPVVPKNPAALDKLKNFMQASWKVMEKAVYVRGHVFHEDAMFPDTVQMGFRMMVEIHSRDDWEPEASKRVAPTDENLKIIFAEKDQAVVEAQTLPAILQADTLGLSQEFADELKDMLDLYVLYVRGFRECARACFLTRKTTMTCDTADVRAARAALPSLYALRDEIIARLRGTHYPHYV
ncbi:MAG: hypothetical protein AB1817_08205, partial [Chloroflexota bacterium]